MSSPFRHFRKHTKSAMAVLFVICMFLFVFASGTGGGGRSGSQDGGAPVATWRGGSLNQRELASLVRQRVIVDEFLRRLFNQGGGRTGYDLPTSVPYLLLPSQRVDQVETDVIATEVMADLARQAGITVSDDMVNHYIEEFSLNNVSQDEILGILGSVGQRDMRENEAIVFSMLRKMLAAYFYRSTFNDMSFVWLPEERWQDWRRVNERISLTAAVLPVESFEKDVPNPEEAQLRALYNEYKDFDPNLWLPVDNATSLPAPTPGFAEPRRVRLAFVMGSVAERTEQFLDKVTEEEIADYYERNKRREFVKTGFGEEEAEETTDGEAPAEQPSAEPGAGEDAPADPAPEGQSAEEAAEPAEQSAEPADDSSTPSAETESARGEGDSSAVKRPSPFRLAAYQEAPADAEEDTSDSEAETSSADAESDEAAAPESEAEGAAATDGEPGADESSEDSDDLDEVLEYEPLEKVRDEIRQTLARDKAVQELQEVMNDAAAELQTQYRDYGLAAALAAEKEQAAPKPPERLADLQWLADKYKLKYEKTALLTDRELYDTAVGKAADARAGNASVTQAAFLTLKLYEPFLAKELEGDWYLVIKTEDHPRRIPEYSEVRDDRVLPAWKRLEAAKLAEAKAKELAKEVSESTQPFEEFFRSKGYEVIPQTEMFSWLDYPLGAGQQQPPSLSEVPQLKNIGPAFMEEAFSLKDDEVKGVLNFDHSIAYVIRLHSRQYPEDELKELFLREDSTFWPGRQELRMQHYFGIKEEVEKRLLEERAGFEFDPEWLKRRRERDLAG